MATLYLKAAGGSWSFPGAWSNTGSGGADISGPPTAADNVILEAGSGNVTIDTGAVCRSISLTSGTGNYAGTITHNSGVTLTIGDGTAGAGNVALNFSSGFTYTLGNATTSAISFVSTSGTAQTVNYNGKTCGNVTFNGAGGSWSLGGTLTSNGTLTLTNGTLNANNQNVTVLAFSSSNSNTRHLTVGSGTWQITGSNAVVWDMATATGFTLTRGSAIQFTYSGGTGTRSLRHGSTGSSATEANSPDISITAGTDTVQLVSATGNSFHDVNFTGFSGTLSGGTRIIYGNLTFSSVMTINATASATTFGATSGTQVLTTNGKNLDLALIFNGAGGTVQLADNLAQGTTTSRAVTFTAGTIDLQDKTWTHFGVFTIGSGSGIRVMTGNGGTYENTLDTASTLWTYTGTNFSTSGTWTIKFTSTANVDQVFAGGGATYPNLWFARGASTGANRVNGGPTLVDIKDTGTAAHSLTFASGVANTTTVTTFTVSGSAGNMITITSSSGTEVHYLVKAGGGTISCDYLNIQHSVATPDNTWYAGTHSVDNQAVADPGSGWIFTDVPSGGPAPHHIRRANEMSGGMAA